LIRQPFRWAHLALPEYPHALPIRVTLVHYTPGQSQIEGFMGGLATISAKSDLGGEIMYGRVGEEA